MLRLLCMLCSQWSRHASAGSLSPADTHSQPNAPARAPRPSPPVQRFFAERGIDVKVEYSWGATEVKASLPGVG